MNVIVKDVATSVTICAQKNKKIAAKVGTGAPAATKPALTIFFETIIIMFYFKLRDYLNYHFNFYFYFLLLLSALVHIENSISQYIVYDNDYIIN